MIVAGGQKNDHFPTHFHHLNNQNRWGASERKWCNNRDPKRMTGSAWVSEPAER
jgi:hypothetical protein